MLKVEAAGIALILEEDKLNVSIESNAVQWKWDREFVPCVIAHEELPFTRWKERSHHIFTNGVGKGIHSSFRCLDGQTSSFAFDTCIWIEESAGTVHFEWIPVNDAGLDVKEVRWPGSMDFRENRNDWYTLINEGQGLLVPNDWPVEFDKLSFNGRFLTAGGYMPWFGQVKERRGYIAIAVTPWNAGVYTSHRGTDGGTQIGVWWEPSLGKMDYRRQLVYTFLPDCDYNDLCKVYRNFVKETGMLVTLSEKAARAESVRDLAGCCFMHCGIKTKVHPESDFFDPENPEKNNHVTPFEVRTTQIEKLHQMGVKKLYLHLDGWAEPGYDNKHPDYLPACEEAGGWAGMSRLEETMHRCGYMFGIHDQYRDYYKDAPSYDTEYATLLPDGTIPEHKRWAGGPQTYLCTTQAPYYVRRNFTEILKHVRLDGTYLDVFTCNEGDECSNPNHRMTRRESYEYRGYCFDWLLSRGILPSSEEVSDWSMRNLVFCHYAPYEFMLKAPGTPRKGLAVPLFNLVYHDCVIEPWMMDKLNGAEDYMLHALLNAGAPYLIRDGAYENADGSFKDGENMSFVQMLSRCTVVSGLHEKTYECEMLSHEMLDPAGSRQRTTFSGGVTVTVDFANNSYEITGI